MKPNVRKAYFTSSKKGDYARKYLSYLTDIIASMDLAIIEAIIEAIQETGRRGGIIYFIGNGGSASVASHYANDMKIGARLPGAKPLNAVSLTDNIPILTALANDEGYEKIFVRQLDGIMTPDDALVAFSVSGNSPNILEAIRYASLLGAVTIGCTGFDGGQLKRAADIVLHIPTNHGEYGPAEDIFAIMGHLIASYLKMAAEQQ